MPAAESFEPTRPVAHLPYHGPLGSVSVDSGATPVADPASFKKIKDSCLVVQYGLRLADQVGRRPSRRRAAPLIQPIRHEWLRRGGTGDWTAGCLRGTRWLLPSRSPVPTTMMIVAVMVANRDSEVINASLELQHCRYVRARAACTTRCAYRHLSSPFTE